MSSSKPSLLRGPALNGQGPHVEEYGVDRSSNSLVRTVRLRNGDVVSSTVPFLPGLPRDSQPNQLFDQAWLRLPKRPEQAAGEEVRVVDLFSGCGGMTVGISEAARAVGLRANPVLALDADSKALRVYQHNLQPERIEGRDIERVLEGDLGTPPTKSEQELMRELGTVDVLLAGPPCQGHSDLNNRTRRDDPKNALFLKVARFAELFRPRHLIIENVQGILHDKTDVFGRTKGYLENDLSQLGYSVDAAKLEAERFGVAQNRHRIFLVASREVVVDLAAMTAPFMVETRPFSWACGDLVSVESDSPFDIPSRSAAISQKRIDYLFDNDCHNLPDSERPPCHRTKEHSYTSVYGRMWADRAAPTITTGFTSMGQGRFVHPTMRRTITPHEAARLQFFPDHFDFGKDNRTTLKRLIGNAVPPKLTYVLGVQLLR